MTMNIVELNEALDRHGKRCVGKVLGQLDIINAPEETKNEVRSRIWAFKDDMMKEFTKGGQ